MAQGSAARGAIVTVLGQGIKLGIQMVSVIVLSRLLEPEDFGLIAMTAAFVALGSLFRDFGMPSAALQARSLSNQQASNLFWINSGLGLAAAIVLLLVTPLVVDFYGDDRLMFLLPVMALSTVFGGVGAQFQVRLSREHKFVSLTVVDIAAQAFGLTVAIVSALLGAGYWALVGQAVMTAGSLLLFQMVASRWLPARPRRRVGTLRIVKSGANFGAAQVLTYAASQADTLVIGSRWGAEEVGVYNRAFQLLNLPMQAMLSPLTRVVIPTVNNARSNGKTVDSVLLRVQFLVGSAAVWIFLVTATTAEYTIPILLGEGWDSTVILFQVLAIGGAVQVFSHVSYWGFMLYDQSHQLLRYNLIIKSLTVLGIVGASFISINAIAWAYSISLLLSWPINLIWLGITARQDSWAYFRNGLRILGAAGVSAALSFIFLIQYGESLPSVSIVLLLVVGATTVYIGVIALFPGGVREIRSAWKMLASAVQRKAA